MPEGETILLVSLSGQIRMTMMSKENKGSKRPKGSLFCKDISIYDKYTVSICGIPGLVTYKQFVLWDIH